MNWNDHFLLLFDRCVKRYKNGEKHYPSYYDDEDLALLSGIGYRQREFFDFVEDFCDEGAPSPSDALLVASVRRDYFHTVMKGEVGKPTVTTENIPTFGEQLEGIHYLPRILAKARAKLRGELDPDLMYGCGGDRKFLRENGNVHLADFLRYVGSAGDDDHAVVRWLRDH